MGTHCPRRINIFYLGCFDVAKELALSNVIDFSDPTDLPRTSERPWDINKACGQQATNGDMDSAHVSYRARASRLL